MTQSGRVVQAVDMSCRILLELQRQEVATLTELTNELDYTKSAVYSHLNTLERNEFVVKDGSEYRISLRFFDLAQTAKKRFANFDVIESEVASLAEQTGEVAQFGTEEHGWVIYLSKERGETGIQSASDIGSREYMHSTALGKAILSAYPDETVGEKIQRRGLPRKTDNTVTSEAELFERINAARDRGYTIDDEENVRGIRCIGVPVENSDTVLGALSVTGPAQRMTDERIRDDLADALSKAANIIEINYQFS